MKVLVTGTGGQVGSALMASAPEEWDVVGLARAELDLADGGAIRAMVARHKPDFVINAAAYTAVDKAEEEAELAQAINGAAPGHFAAALAEMGGRLVQVSTDFVFDGTSSTPYTPDAPRNPLSVYGASKAAGEDAAGADAIICRTSWVYAAGGANFVRTMLRLMGERDALNVVSDQIGAPTHAAGLAQALWGLARANVPGTYHYQDAGVASWYDFAVAIYEEARALGLLTRDVAIAPIPTSQYPTPAARPAFSVLDVTETTGILNEAPSHWRANLREMLQEEQRIG
ncbi:dTDP-4-dehydrorhamnose reductase [Alteripontixanthobacter maritimus]|uniref:dTDP-4-dehydrorhamnose reductase n=1 Tax=Alteripontixanthobacter maritimus TaxID=2161824 RepID=A0A369Q465_9SPHN|nr:dTDP-4-dehydrorhamnose reductase [Alteripontixanthobacter maritimus]RDC59681.1 dTDP-4-dehydrorhamnose reductase [Alteripontixanthobacter maritimus]